MNTLHTERNSGSVTSVINAGGRATRLSEFFPQEGDKGIAKAIRIDVGRHSGGESLLAIDHQINQQLGQKAIDSIVVSAGDQDAVADYVDLRYKNDERVQVVSDTLSHGTGGDLINAVRSNPELFGDIILVSNVDTIVRIDYAALIRRFKQDPAYATIALSKRTDSKNAGAYVVFDGQVVSSEEFGELNPAPQFHLMSHIVERATSTGVVAFDKDFVEQFPWSPVDGEVSVYKELLAGALSAQALTAFDNGMHFVRDVATHDTWVMSRNDSSLQKELAYKSR